MKNLNKKITILSFLLLLSFVNLNAQTYNTLTGIDAGVSLTTGDDNTFTGYQCGYYTTTGVKNTFTGYKSGNDNISGSLNTFDGYDAGRLTTTGNYNTFIGSSAGWRNETGEGNTCIGTYANLSISGLKNATAIGYNASVSADNSLVLGDNVNVGIGISAPVYKLQISGTGSKAAKPGSSTWTIASDKNLKTDIKPFNDGLRIIEQINPITFKYNGLANMPTEETYVGITAQEMREIAPYTVGIFSYQDSLGNKTEYLDYDANAVTYIMINAIKELSAQLKSLQNQIDSLSKSTSVKTNSMEELQNEGNAHLLQNSPNPFSESTIIDYYFPETSNSGKINMYNFNGQLVKSIPLTEKGHSSIVISAGDIKSGIYNYELLIDDKIIKQNRMVVSK